MPVASLVRLVPPQAWGEDQLLEAARRLLPEPGAVRPGDDVGGLVVVAVVPEAGARLAAATELEILAEPRTARAPIVDLAVLLDVSESMEEPWSADLSRLDAARAALGAFLGRAQPSVGDVTLLEYAREARIVAGPAPPSDLKLPEAPEPRGGSRTANALDSALAHLAARGRSDRCQSIILLTDGAGELPELRLAARRAGRLSVPVHILVFAPAMDPVFDEVAEAAGGSVQIAALPLEIDFVHEGAA